VFTIAITRNEHLAVLWPNVVAGHMSAIAVAKPYDWGINWAARKAPGGALRWRDVRLLCPDYVCGSYGIQRGGRGSGGFASSLVSVGWTGGGVFLWG
jgi:hypothetical protein